MFEDDPYPPLITPRSPSYERASREFLHPTSTGNPQVIAIDRAPQRGGAKRERRMCEPGANGLG